MISLVTLSDFLPEEFLVLARSGVGQQVVRDVMEGARAFWIQQAQQKLHTSRRDYINGIHEVVEGDGFAAVTLVGVVPLMVEQGASPFDMHQTLLGPNVPIAMPGGRGKHVNAQGGFYRAIPFRHQGPDTIGQGGGQPMGSQYYRGANFKPFPGIAAALQGELGKAVMAQARRLAPTKGMPGGPVQYGGRLPAGVAGVQKLRPHHSTDIYAGMIRQQKTYGRATQNTYTTFRTISDSVPGKWLHPGIQPANLQAEVVKHVERIAPKAFLAAAWGS